MTKTLPDAFCWSRFGTEAGETIASILHRKELERQRNNGVFLWGIGNALGPSMKELLRSHLAPEVIFSPIRSAPKRQDVAPSAVWRWTSARDLNGAPVNLPKFSLVTSRATSGPRSPRHYALVCQSSVPLALEPSPPSIAMGAVHNLLSDAKVGASQVTAVVRYLADSALAGPTYPAAFRAALVAPFFLELADPRLA